MRSQVQTGHNGNKLEASKRIVATEMKLYFHCRYLTVVNPFVQAFPLSYEVIIFKRRHRTGDLHEKGDIRKNSNFLGSLIKSTNC